MIFSRRFSGLIDTLLRKNLPFAAWFLPGDDQPSIVIQQSLELLKLDSFTALERHRGFVFAPFVITDNAPLVVIRPDIQLTGYQQIKQFNFFTLPNYRSEHHLGLRAPELQKKEYLSSLRGIIDKIRGNHIEKLIFSRLFYQKRDRRQSLGLLLEQMQQQNPGALNYLVNLPKVGTWMGATPEMLLTGKEDELTTMALAGTQYCRADNRYEWPDKEKQEQAFVSNYIRQLLSCYSVGGAEESPLHSVESGNVAHLCTRFTFSRRALAGRLGNFINDLHPTPAVCGLPKEKALQTILRSEPHAREYYTGFLGLWDATEDFDLFVNLRCMKITAEEFVLYSGGGITSGSTPEGEWEETRAKSSTLLSAIRGVSS